MCSFQETDPARIEQCLEFAKELSSELTAHFSGRGHLFRFHSSGRKPYTFRAKLVKCTSPTNGLIMIQDADARKISLKEADFGIWISGLRFDEGGSHPLAELKALAGASSLFAVLKFDQQHQETSYTLCLECFPHLIPITFLLRVQEFAKQVLKQPTVFSDSWPSLEETPRP